MAPSNYTDSDSQKAKRGKHARRATPQFDEKAQSDMGSLPEVSVGDGDFGSFDSPVSTRRAGSSRGAAERGSYNGGYTQGQRSGAHSLLHDRPNKNQGYTQGQHSGAHSSEPPANRTTSGYTQGQRSGTYSVPSVDASMYSRNSSRYESGSPRDMYMPKRRKSQGKRIVLGVLIALLVVVGIASAAGLWYASRLDAALSQGEDSAAKDVLAASDEGSAFYMLVLGSDSREGSGTSSDPSMSGDQQRSDVMLLLRVDPTDKSVTMMSIPRDTPYGYDQTLGKINEAYNQSGPSGSIAAVSELTGLPISHYAEVHISELEHIVDAVGGVTVNVEQEIDVKDTLTGKVETLSPGTQTLDGQQAQVFVRARRQYSDGDVSRQNNVRTLTMAIAKKVVDRPVNEIPDTVIDLAQYVGTDLKSSDLVSLAMAFAGSDIKQTTIKTPTSGENCEYANNLWICYVNPVGWNAAVESLKAGSQTNDYDFSSTEYPWSQEICDAMVVHGANQAEAVASLGSQSSVQSG